MASHDPGRASLPASHDAIRLGQSLAFPESRKAISSAQRWNEARRTEPAPTDPACRRGAPSPNVGHPGVQRSRPLHLLLRESQTREDDHPKQALPSSSAPGPVAQRMTDAEGKALLIGSELSPDPIDRLLERHIDRCRVSDRRRGSRQRSATPTAPGLSSGFNPCGGGLQSSTISDRICLSSRRGFNPCCGGLQSSTRPRRPKRPASSRCFNPCCGGLQSSTGG